MPTAATSHAQAVEMRADGAREAVARVASFEHRHEASTRMLPGDTGDDRRQLGEVGVGEGELAERIAGARIEAGRNHHELRLEALRRRHQPGAKRAENLVAARAGRERPVDDAAAALSFTGF